MPNVVLYSYLAYLVVFLAVAMAYVGWKRRRRKTKLPFDVKTERAMRLPGEGARAKIDALSDRIVESMVVASFVPFLLFIAYRVMSLLLKPIGVTEAGLLWFFPYACVGFVIFFVRRLAKDVFTRSDWYLGQFGERNVADNLEPLRDRGWRVFHDVPAERKGVKFNIDHVVVGPAGVFAIETKTPRRPETPKGGREAHVVKYDGARLYWPTGAIDDIKPRQARSRAGWLEDWLKTKRVPAAVVPILAIPWWFIAKRDEHADYDVPVVNPKQLVGLLAGKPRTLSDAQVSEISATLRAHCCDVQF